MTDKSLFPRVALAYVRRESIADGRYIRALATANAQPVPLWSDEPDWEDRLESAHGLVLTGGGDIDPALYVRGADVGVCEGVDRARDERERAVFTAARRKGIPILGICRGMQLMNVLYDASSGLLKPDLPQHPIRHRSFPGGDSAFHEVHVETGTKLAALAGKGGILRVNSRHHQGITVGDVARGLVVSAIAADGVVEAIEAPGEPFLLAVQCHPEREGEAPDFVPVISGLVAAAREFAFRRERPAL